MNIVEGLLYINDVDVYVEYGVFLAEKTPAGHENYDALFAPPGTKEQVAIDIWEQDGEKLPDDLKIVFKPRDVTLYFSIEAGTRAEFTRRRTDFLKFLRTGNRGWLNFRLTEIDKTFRFYLKDFPDWEQDIYSDEISEARFKVTFREPNPTI